MVARSDDVADEHHAQDQPRHDAADQQAGDRDAGKAAEQHGERRRRDQHVDAADAHDRSHGHARLIAARQHGRQHQAAEQRGGGDGRARDRREHRAGDDRDHRQPRRHAPDQEREGVDRLQRDAGVEQHLAHQHEERDRRQRKAGDRLHRIAGELREARLAAEEEQGADDVERRNAKATGRPSPITATRPPNKSRLPSIQVMRSAHRRRFDAARPRALEQAVEAEHEFDRQQHERRPAAAPAATTPETRGS